MKFGSVCSGIEAASVAWHPLGWEAAWLSEIEPFPCALLAHHYPHVPNLGDMKTLPDRIRSGEVEAPDLFCGGTPCQAFSVAGLRHSLDDARGNLSLTFCEIANAIDSVRTIPSIVFWENVPGVLNTKDNAFGCFLGAIAGEDDALIPPGGRWANAGFIDGAKRAVAWRILDAQYFGVAQRRRRVFVVASARAGFDPAAVLFEFDGVRRDTAPRRETRQVAPTIHARSTAGGGLGTDFDLDGGVITMAHGQGGAEIGFDRGPTLTCNHEAPIAAYTAHTLRGEGFDASEDGTGRGTPLVPVHCRDVAQTITSNYGKQVDNSDAALGPNVVAFHPTQDPIHSGDVCHSLGANDNATAAVLAPTLTASNDPSRSPQSSEVTKQVWAVMQATQQAVLAFKSGQSEAAEATFVTEEYAPTLQAQNNGSTATPAVLAAMQVRRLTPVECERLQGFPDDYTDIKPKGKPTPDGPRYKALGNSWAVPVVRWIGKRIANEIA